MNSLDLYFRSIFHESTRYIQIFQDGIITEWWAEIELEYYITGKRAIVSLSAVETFSRVAAKSPQQPANRMTPGQH